MPGPPPGAAAVVAAEVVVVLVAAVVPESRLLALILCRNPGFGVGVAVAIAVLGLAAGDASVLAARLRLAGDALAAGLSAEVAEASFFDFFFAAGDALAAGLSAGLGEASFFAECLCFAGDAAGLSAGLGSWATARAVVNARTTVKQANFFMVRARYSEAA